MVLMGFDINAVTDLVEKADAQGVTMVSEATPFEEGLPIFGNVNITGGFIEAGRQLGAWTANDSQERRGSGFSADVNPGLVERYEGFREYLDQFSGVEFVEEEPIVIPEADVGPPLQARARAVLQSHPKGTVDYIYAPADGWATFIVNALQPSGRDEVKVVAFDGAEQNMEFIREGRNQVATQACPWGWCGWMTMDQLNRGMQGEESSTRAVPRRCLTKQTCPPRARCWTVTWTSRRSSRSSGAPSRTDRSRGAAARARRKSIGTQEGKVMSVEALMRRIHAAIGERPLDMVVHGGRVVNVYNGEIEVADVGIVDDTIVWVGELARAPRRSGRRVGLVRSHVVPGLSIPIFTSADRSSVSPNLHEHYSRAAPRRS